MRLRRALFTHLPRLALRWLKADKGELGRAGEALASAELVRAGWRVLGRRVQTPHGELDLVLCSDEQLVCVEVKAARVWADPTSLDEAHRPGRRLDPRRLASQRRAARWLARGPWGAGRAARVDLVEVYWREDQGRARLMHHPDYSGRFWRAPFTAS